MSVQAEQKRRTLRRVIIPAVLLLLVFLAAALYVSDDYGPEPAAEALLTDAPEGITVTREKGRIVFIPEIINGGLIFYPGGKVRAAAYAPLMTSLAQKNILCVLIEMPLNLAFFGTGAADKVYADYPEAGIWVLAGHSLGGVAAASYAAGHTEKLSGLVLLASYSTADLAGSGLKVLSLYGSEDRVLNLEEFEKNRSKLPADAAVTVIPGGNHAGFGAYGIQKGDGTATLSPSEQMEFTAEEILRFMEGLSR